MTNREVLGLLKQSKELFKDVSGYSFNRVIVDAEERLEKEKKALDKIMGDVEKEYDEYRKEAHELSTSFCKKKDDGTPDFDAVPVGNDSYRIIYNFDKKHEKERKKKFDELNKKYKGVIDAYNEKVKKYEEALGEESKYEKPEIHEKQIPKNLNTEQTRLVFKMLKVKEG